MFRLGKDRLEKGIVRVADEPRGQVPAPLFVPVLVAIFAIFLATPIRLIPVHGEGIGPDPAGWKGECGGGDHVDGTTPESNTPVSLVVSSWIGTPAFTLAPPGQICSHFHLLIDDYQKLLSEIAADKAPLECPGDTYAGEDLAGIFQILSERIPASNKSCQSDTR